jgi:hypothetical protein
MEILTRINAINGRKIIKAKTATLGFRMEVTFLEDHCHWLLTIITLGFYYPWAKTIAISLWRNVARRRCIAFHGTGKEMFKGLKSLYYLFHGILASCDC